jgi:hypothetical protein
MTSLILDHIARAYLYLGISTGKKVMILLLSIVLELSQDRTRPNSTLRNPLICRPLLSLKFSILVSQPLLLNYSHNTCSLNLACSLEPCVST